MLTLDANNRSMLARTLESIAEMDSMIESYMAQDEAMAERQKILTQQLKETEHQRKKIKDTIASARVSKQALESAAGSLRGLFSPIRRLPVEILSNIFYILLLSEQSRRRRRMVKWKMTKIPCTPLVLGRVCSQWRTIVNQTPRLWEDIHIQQVSFLSPSGGDKAQQAINRISQYKTLGIQANQSIFIEAWVDSGPEVLLSLLGSHRTPWKSIEIAVSGNASGQWDIEAIHATNVKLFRIRQKHALGHFEPLLRRATSLFITGMPPVWGSDPWTSLISLEIRPWVSPSGETEGILPFQLEPEHLIRLLSSAPNLEELVLAFPTGSDLLHIHSSGGQPVAHGSIKSLSIHLHHLETDLTLFGVHVAAPSLRNLTILSFDCYCDCPSTSDTPIGWDRLTSLSLARIADTDQVLRAARLLRRLPTIETLKVKGSNVDELFTVTYPMLHQTPHQTAQIPLPRLTKLIMRETDIQGSTLIRFLSMRLPGSEGDSEGLRAVTDIDLFENPGVLPQDWNDIKILLETGRSHNASRVGSAM
jgi:F-box-like